ncbi:hypothetical protein [Microbacterium sp. NPDC057650]|uniref:hypothetical protein n=1 Tax=unclassified Microbacterium TaxID=2609290 RepID=UPI003670BCA3
MQHWLRALIPADLAGSDLDRLRIDVQLDGDDIADLLVDATGVDIRLSDEAFAPDTDPAPAHPDATETPAPEPISSTEGIARSIRFLASPAHLEGYPFVVDVQVHDAPLRWVRYAAPLEEGRPETVVSVDESVHGLSQATGSIELRMRTVDLGPLVQTLVSRALAAEGMKLRRLKVDVAAHGEKVTISASGAIRWRILGASAHARVSLRVTPNGVITVQKIRLGSRNPLIAMALRLKSVRDSVREAEGTSTDLGAELARDAGGPAFHDLCVRVDQQIRITGRLG